MVGIVLIATGGYYYATEPGPAIPEPTRRAAWRQATQAVLPKPKRRFTAVDIEQCRAAGGEMGEPEGMNVTVDLDLCNHRLPDAGKLCTDSNQCVGACSRKDRHGGYYRRFGFFGPEMGYCEASDAVRAGCFEDIAQGKVARMSCTD